MAVLLLLAILVPAVFCQTSPAPEGTTPGGAEGTATPGGNGGTEGTATPGGNGGTGGTVTPGGNGVAEGTAAPGGTGGPEGTATPGGTGGTEGTATPGGAEGTATPGGVEGPPAPGGNQTAGGNQTIGDAEPGVPTKTFVVCVKKDEGAELPVSEYLTKPNGKSKKVPGTWLVFNCKYGELDVFKVDKKTFDDVTKACKDKGYEHPQPGDDMHPSSYPFLVDQTVTEYFRHRTPFTFSHNPPTPVDRCSDVTTAEE